MAERVTDLVGFISYAHTPLEEDREYLRDFRRKLEGHLGTVTAKHCEIFHDDDIQHGDKFLQILKSKVQSAHFFVPIISPMYVESDYCQKELEWFLERESELGRDNLIFPVLFIHVANLSEPHRARQHPVLKVIAERQWDDWQDERFKQLSGEVSKKLYQLAITISNRLGDVRTLHFATALSRLQRQQWDEAKDQALAVQEKYRGRHDYVEFRESIEQVAAEGRTFVDAWRRVVETRERRDDEQLPDAVDELVRVARPMLVEQLEQLKLADNGFFKEMKTAIRAVAAYDSGDFGGVNDLQGASSGSSAFDLKPMVELAQGERACKQVLDELWSLLRDRNWDELSRRLRDVEARGMTVGTRRGREIQAIRKLVDDIQDAFAAFEQGKFERAVAILRNISRQEDLPEIKLAIQLAEIGECTADATKSQDEQAIVDLEQQFSELATSDCADSDLATRLRVQLEIRLSDARLVIAARGALEKAVEALLLGNVSQAQAWLDDASQRDLPPQLEVLRDIVEVGLRAARATADGDPAAFPSLQSELQSILQRTSAAEAPEKATTQVAELVEVGHTTAKYRAAVKDYEEGRFCRARKLFQELGNYQDSEDRAQQCETWITVTELLRHEDWDQAKKLLEQSPWLEADKPRVVAWREWTRRGRKLLPMLRRLAAGPLLRDSRAPVESNECPYKLFAPLGISPTSSMEQCDKLGFQLQSKADGMTSVDRSAWDTLRSVDKRLVADFTLYKVEYPQRAGRLAERLCTIDEGDEPGLTVPEILDELGEDQGVFQVLLGNYDEAIAYFRRRGREAPHELAHFHHLGLAAVAKVQALKRWVGEEGQVVDAWRHAIVGMGPVFADDDFWHNWWVARVKIYKSSVEQSAVQKARLNLQRLWRGEMSAAAGVFPAAETLFNAELNGARAIRMGGGLPLGEGGSPRAVVGPLGAQLLELTGAVTNWTAQFDAQHLERWQQQVCRYFSELALPTALFETGRYAEMVRLLSEPRCEKQRRGDSSCAAVDLANNPSHVAARSCACFRDLNPALHGVEGGDKWLRKEAVELLVQAHSKVALKAVSAFPVDLPATFQHWDTAVELAKSQGKNLEVLREIIEVATGRAATLVDRFDDQRLVSLNDAVDLLQEVRKRGWDNKDRQIEMSLASALVGRAVHLSVEYDNEAESRKDALTAYSLQPDDERTTWVVCQATLNLAFEMYGGGEEVDALALANEAEELINDKKDKFDLEGPESCLRTFRETISEGGKLEKFLAELSEAPDQAGRQYTGNAPLTDAMIKEAQKDFAGAVDAYWSLVQADPENQNLRAKLAWCYRDWIMSEDESPDELRRIVKEARERCPESEALTDIISGLDE